MRWTRAGTVVGILGLVLLCAGWWLSATGASKPAPRGAQTLSTSGLNPSLQRQLQTYLSLARSPVVPESRVPPVLELTPTLAPRDLQIGPHGSTCPVAAGGFCSLEPCIQFAGAGAGAGTAVPSAVIAATAGGPAVLRPSLARPTGPSLTGPTAKLTPRPVRPSCQGRAGPPQMLRVSGA